MVLFLLFVSGARADVVDPEPDSCPPGARPATSHSGPYCAPLPDCTGDAECGASARCGPVMQCIEERACGGLMPPDAEPCTIEHVVGPCGAGDTCSTGVCRARQVCTTPSTEDGGCGCSSASGGGIAALALVLAGVFALSRRVRAPRR
jgi:MYXO-CTERM domain-containing protein